MRKFSLGFLLSAALVATAAHAEFSVTPTLTNDYDFRGVSQSAKDFAPQLSLDYAHDSGFYAYAWGSKIDFGPDSNSDVELDLAIGYGQELANGISWDSGLVWYTYPGESDFNYPEAWVGLSRGWFSAKLWYSWDYVAADQSAWYLEANGEFPLPQDWSLQVHAGVSTGPFWDDANGGEYEDWSVGVARSFGKFDFSIKWVDSIDLPPSGEDLFSTDGRVIVAVSTTLPWGKDE
ncbi:MAG: TorF family putative porin [Steroidobacteraceae bacterium]